MIELPTIPRPTIRPTIRFRRRPGGLYDSYGRRIDYLRMSLIDHCNLRCVYCMPLKGLRFIPRPDLLTAEEIEQIARVAASVGFHKIRLTGGEPTLRPDLIEIVERLARIDGLSTLAMTTNGILLPELAQDLKRAGLTRVNIHIDTVNEANLKRLMRWGDLQKAMAGIYAAEEAGLTPVKLNAVVLRGYNEEDVVELAELTIDQPWHMRWYLGHALGDSSQ